MTQPQTRQHMSKTQKKSKEVWRRYGAARRKALIQKDEIEGGTRFELRKKCQIERYFHITHKAVADFEKKCRDPSANLEETYVMGHRLQAFLGQALPQHPHYRKMQVSHLRKRCKQDLEWIRQQMHELAVKIDEEQLNDYITMDFDPQLEDDSSSSSEESFDFSDVDDSPWEAFTGWSFEFTNMPAAIETDSSTVTTSCHDVSESAVEQDYHSVLTEVQTPVDEEEDDDDDSVSEAQAIVSFQDEDDDQKSRCTLNDEATATEFLKKIADEDVCYESDSEAVDSWAQDGDSNALSCASSGTTLTYDPARIAFREIMNQLPRQKLLKNSLSSSKTRASSSLLVRRSE